MTQDDSRRLRTTLDDYVTKQLRVIPDDTERLQTAPDDSERLRTTLEDSR